MSHIINKLKELLFKKVSKVCIVFREFPVTIHELSFSDIFVARKLSRVYFKLRKILESEKLSVEETLKLTGNCMEIEDTLMKLSLAAYKSSLITAGGK